MKKVIVEGNNDTMIQLTVDIVGGTDYTPAVYILRPLATPEYPVYVETGWQVKTSLIVSFDEKGVNFPTLVEDLLALDCVSSVAWE